MPVKKKSFASMFTLRKDGRYMGHWHDKDGKRHAIYNRDPEALYEAIREKEQTFKDPASLPFSRVAEEWSIEYRKTVTVRSWLNLKPHYENMLDRYKDFGIGDVTGVEVNRHYLQVKAQGYSRTVVNNIRVIYNGIFNYAVSQGYIQFNPAISVKFPKGLVTGKRSAPTDEQIQIITQNIDKPFGFFPFLLICTGLRKGEALALTKSDIDFKRRVIHVTKSIVYTDNTNPDVKDPKTEAGKRDVPIVSALYGELVNYCKNQPSDILFPAQKSNRGGNGGGYMTEKGYEGSWLRYCQEVGLIDKASGKPSLTAHCLRHGTATLLFESGADVYTAQKILGHANVNVTMEIYTELRDKQKARSIEKFSQSLSAYANKDTDKSNQN